MIYGDHAEGCKILHIYTLTPFKKKSDFFSLELIQFKSKNEFY